MQISVKKIDGANAVITASFDKEAIAKAENIAAAKIAKETKIAGFRQGKVPASVIKSRFKDRLNADSKSQLANQAFEEGLKKLDKPDLIGMPIVSKSGENDGALELELKLALRPVIELGDYESLTPSFKPIEISPETLRETMEKAADASVAPEAIAEKRGLKKGDYAQFDFSGFIDGKPLANATAKDYELKIGSNGFVPGFEEQMIGLKAGEERKIAVTFPNEYHAKEIAGKEVTFDVALKAIKVKKNVELNDETAKKLLPGIEDANMEKLEAAVKKTLLDERKVKLYNEELRPKLIEALLKKYDFDLPEIILEQEIDHLATQKARTLGEEELRKLQTDEKALKNLREEFRAEAKERVKTTLLIDAIAKAEHIAVSDREVTQAIYYQALQSGQNPQEALEYYRKNNLTAVVRMSLTEDRALTTLLDRKAAAQEDAPKPAKPKKERQSESGDEGDETPAKKSVKKRSAAKKES
ncbi:MAG: trigger factor [Helicobacteraceae bacterium]|jgi:trigger factor|nr:trigger factor [Helicobacteraceae bacterium]